MKKSRLDKSILIANIVDHFDTAIYAFLAPSMAPLFFPDHEPIIQLILAYSVMMTSIITRPLGALLIGLYAKKNGPIQSLSYALMGVSFFTICLGLLPTFKDIGYHAAIILVIIRMMRGIFASGESTIAKLYIMQNKSDDKAFQISYWYQGSTMIGIVLASLLATYLPWRFCFLLGGSIGLFGFLLRSYGIKNVNRFDGYESPVLYTLWQEKYNVLRILLTTGISHITYTIPFVLFNALIPLITDISFESMMVLNSILLLFDTILILIVGPFLRRYSIDNIMGGALLMLCLAIPALCFLERSTIYYITSVRLWIVFWGVIFSTPLNLYYKKLLKNNTNQYLIAGMATAIGASTIGKCTPLCLFLFHKTGSSISIAIYISIVFLCTLVVCIFKGSSIKK